MHIGYARVSTTHQSLALQKEALEKAGCEKIFEDILSGSTTQRPGLDRALEMLRSGDTLVIWKLDRLGRTFRHLLDLVADMEKRGIHFCSVTEAIETKSPGGRLFFHIMASLSQMERELLVERTQAGLKKARSLGRLGGRPKLMSPAKVEAAQKMREAGMLRRDIAQTLGVSLATLYNWLPGGGAEA